MAEYKYRALGWQDNDIASLNVVDGTAADNQVELQITKQGAGGTIDGPAIVGKDGITINKAADSEKIEISGSGLIQDSVPGVNNLGAPLVPVKNSGASKFGFTFMRNKSVPSVNERDLIGYDSAGAAYVPHVANDDRSITNKKYVDDNYVKKVKPVSSYYQLYGLNTIGEQTFPVDNSEGQIGAISKFWQSEIGANPPKGYLVTNTPTKPYQCANKKYVDEADKNLRLKFSNLEQTLNGYILDTTKEAYADLDSAVLKDSVAVGDNVYPIADKTRALVSRIEGKTTKMVQVLDKSTFPATSTPVVGLTVTKTDDGGLHVLGTTTGGGGRNSWGITVEIKKGHRYLNLLKGNKKLSSPIITLKSDVSQYLGIMNIVTSTIEGECYYGFNLAAEDYDETIYPQLFDLTAMNREDITSVEQFKAEFPDLYPYENGNIYPAKISGVKFTGKNLFDSNPNNLIFNTGNVEVVGNNIIITGYKENGRFTYKAIPLIIGETYTVSVSNYTKENSNALGLGISYDDTADITFGLITETNHTFTFKAERNQLFIKGYITYDAGDAKITISNLQVETGSQATPYEPYIEPVSVTLPETYDLHGIGNYKDYLEITKNEDNELYTLKKVQNVGVYEYTGNEAWTVGDDNFTSVFRYYCTDIMIPQTLGDKGICNKYATLTAAKDEEGVLFGLSNNFIYLFLNKTNFPDINSVKSYLSAQYAENNPVVIYYRLSSPVETVIATNLTYEQVTAIRHNGGLIEVEGNTNKGYARPTVTNTIVYRLTASTTVDGTSIVKDTDGKIQLNQEYIDYLDNQLYQPPAISVFTMLDAAGAALPTSNELGTTLSAASFNHQETNIKNIQGDNVELHINNAVAATTSTAKKDVATKVTLTTAQSITSSTKFTLKGTNTKGAAFSRDYQVNFYRYAYTATTDATTAPTSGATQQAAVSTFASNGSTFNYTKGAYIYFYTDNTGKKVQTNVLGQWADVDTTDMGKVTLTQSNGATHEYTCYRIGPFIETGSAKYRV